MIISQANARTNARAAALRLCDDLRDMVAETSDQFDPTTAAKTWRFVKLTLRANRSLSRLVKATKPLEAEVVAGLDSESARAAKAVFARARKERNVGLLLSLVEH